VWAVRILSENSQSIEGLSFVMKTKFLNQKIDYTGAELRSQWNYFEHGLLGNSAVAFIGSCQVEFSEMLDGEDLLAGQTIQGSEMLHFILEIYDINLFAGVAFQRLFADLARGELIKLNPKLRGQIERSGDDLYFEGRKLSISIAAPSVRSVLIHWAINISNEGTPVPTASLQDLDVEPLQFAQSLLTIASQELDSIVEATWKVKSIK